MPNEGRSQQEAQPTATNGVSPRQPRRLSPSRCSYTEADTEGDNLSPKWHALPPWKPWGFGEGEGARGERDRQTHPPRFFSPDCCAVVFLVQRGANYYGGGLRVYCADSHGIFFDAPLGRVIIDSSADVLAVGGQVQCERTSTPVSTTAVVTVKLVLGAEGGTALLVERAICRPLV